MHQQWQRQYEDWENTPNRYAIKPIIPAGHSYSGLLQAYCSGSEIVEFCNLVSDYGYTDVSIYLYDKFSEEAWEAYSTCFGELVIKAFCPIDLLITDPDGFQISKYTNEVFGATYLEFDSNGDGELDDLVAIPEKTTGEYMVELIPEGGTLPTDTFSLKVLSNGGTIVSAENIAIKDIPADPYIIESSEDGLIRVRVPMKSFLVTSSLITWDSRGRNVLTASGEFELPNGYTKTDLEKSALLHIDIDGVKGKDQVALKGKSVMWSYQEPSFPAGDDSLGLGVDIKNMTITSFRGQAFFHVRAQFDLEGVDADTVPREATISLEIPLASEEQAGSIAGTETIAFDGFYNWWWYTH